MRVRLVCPGEVKGAHRLLRGVGTRRRFAYRARPGPERDRFGSVVPCVRDTGSVTIGSMPSIPNISVERVESPVRPARYLSRRVSAWIPLCLVAGAMAVVGVSGVRGADYPAHFVRALLW